MTLSLSRLDEIRATASGMENLGCGMTMECGEVLSLISLACQALTAQSGWRTEAPDGWDVVGPGTPCEAWLETMKAGESGTNVCRARVICIGGDVEWIEKSSGRTTVTHHSFAAPDFWRWPAPPTGET